MLQFQRSHGQLADSDMIARAEEHQNANTSMFYQALPTVVQNRMPHLPSIRQSFSDLRRPRSLHSKTNSLTETLLPQTPPPEYASRPGSGIATPQRNGTSHFEFDDDESVASSTCSTPPLTLHYETSTGISWRYARHGVAAMEQAHREASIPSHDDDVMATIIRSQYVHSLTLFLRSLPPMLTSAEQMSLHDAMPRSIMEHDKSTPKVMNADSTESGSTDDSERSLLWRTTAWLVLRLLLLMQILLPYIRLLLRRVARFENEQQITRRVFNTSVAVGSGVSRECWKVSRAVCQMKDGMLGDVVSEAVVYCAESIGGGIQQGLAEARLRRVMERKRSEVIAQS